MKFSRHTQVIYHEGSKKISEFKNSFFRLLPFWLAGSITALVATGYAKIFAWAEHLSLEIFKSVGYGFLIIAPLSFLVSWILVHSWAPRSNGSGIPQLMAAVELSDQKDSSIVNKLLGFRIIIVSKIEFKLFSYRYYSCSYFRWGHIANDHGIISLSRISFCSLF